MAGTKCSREERQKEIQQRDRMKEGTAQLTTPSPAHPQAKEVPGVKVFRSSATLYFANAELYSDALKQRVRPGSPSGRPRAPHFPRVPSPLL